MRVHREHVADENTRLHSLRCGGWRTTRKFRIGALAEFMTNALVTSAATTLFPFVWPRRWASFPSCLHRGVAPAAIDTCSFPTGFGNDVI
jgi:hypothetical protein